MGLFFISKQTRVFQSLCFVSLSLLFSGLTFLNSAVASFSPSKYCESSLTDSTPWPPVSHPLFARSFFRSLLQDPWIETDAEYSKGRSEIIDLFDRVTGSPETKKQRKNQKEITPQQLRSLLKIAQRIFRWRGIRVQMESVDVGTQGAMVALRILPDEQGALLNRLAASVSKLKNPVKIYYAPKALFREYGVSAEVVSSTQGTLLLLPHRAVVSPVRSDRSTLHELWHIVENELEYRRVFRWVQAEYSLIQGKSASLYGAYKDWYSLQELSTYSLNLRMEREVLRSIEATKDEVTEVDWGYALEDLKCIQVDARLSRIHAQRMVRLAKEVHAVMSKDVWNFGKKDSSSMVGFRFFGNNVEASLVWKSPQTKKEKKSAATHRLDFMMNEVVVTEEQKKKIMAGNADEIAELKKKVLAHLEGMIEYSTGLVPEFRAIESYVNLPMPTYEERNSAVYDEWYSNFLHVLSQPWLYSTRDLR